MAANLDVPVHTVREMEQRMSSHDVAFDGPETDDGEFASSPSGYLPDMRYNPEQLVSAKQTTNENNTALHSAIADLDDRSRDILQRRWLGESKATLHELAAEYGVSAERIRQIEKRAMDKMKNQLIA